MVGPVTFDEYDPVPNRTLQRKERREDVTTGATSIGAAVNAAGLPYAGETAAEQLRRIILQNEELQRQLNRAQKGTPLEGDDKTRLITDVDAYEKLVQAIDNFNPDYVGTVLDLPGQIETALQKRVSSDIGTPGQADFWSSMKFLDMLTRNKYFGASLSGNEKASYAETTISPGDTAETALKNLKRRAEILRKGIRRNVNSLRAGGYNPGQINAQLGNYLADLNPRWMSPEEERVLSTYASSKDFDPNVYSEMLLKMGDANGLRLDPQAAKSAAQAVAEKRAKGETTFGGAAVYQGTQPPEEDNDKAAAPGGTADAGGGGDGLGWGETLGSAAVNFVPDVVNEVQGIADAVLHPINTATSVAQLGGGVLSMMGVGDFDQSTARALGKYYANKYGSIEGFKKELAEHPASILGDVAMVFTGGGAAAAKLGIPAKLSAQIARMGPRAVRAADIALAASKNVDPITALTNLVTKAAPAAVRGTGRAAGTAASETLGLTTGAGGAAIREASSAGFNRRLGNAQADVADAFLDAMRNPGASADQVVQLARDAVGNLRQQASQRYLADMARFGRNPVPLDINVVRQRLASIKPKSYDTWRDSQGPRPTSHKAWETMNQFVDEYAYKATQDPSLLDPLAMDQFKQDLYDVGSKVGGAYDRDAARIAGTAYNGVKQELIKHDPVYANTMRDYERAATEAQQLENSFSLAAARGKQPNIESAGRKLTSIFRNNVNTNYGTRAAQAERLAELDPTGQLFPTLAGQSLNSWAPRGIQRAGAAGLTSTGLAGMGLDMIPMAMDLPGYLSGSNLAALPLMSPRLMGEAAYYGGRGAGAVADLMEPVTSRTASVGNWLADKQRQYRTPLMASGVAGMNIAAMQNPELQQLTQQYETPPEEEMTVHAPGMVQQEEQPEDAPQLVPGPDGVFFLVQNGQIDPTPRDQDGNPIPQKARGGLMSLARKYR